MTVAPFQGLVNVAFIAFAKQPAPAQRYKDSRFLAGLHTGLCTPA
jgi:hypothetical protein